MTYGNSGADVKGVDPFDFKRLGSVSTVANGAS